MIICHCNVIDCERIETAVGEALQRMPASCIKPEHVFSECGTKPNCGCCCELMGMIIEDVAADLGQRA